MHILIALLIVFCSIDSYADSPLWGNLQPGPYGVGFTARFEYDYSRTFRPKRDLDGKVVTGSRARPIQIAIWYPAEKGSSSMQYEEYTYLVARELEFGPLTDAIKRQGRAQFYRQRQNFSRATDAAMDQLFESRTAAVKDAHQIAGKFPLLIYAPGHSGSTVENPILCEFLASYGYIVAAIPSMGAYSRTASVDLTGFYAYMQDIEFAIGYMHRFPNIDPDRLAIIGFSMGGSAATLVQMRNFDIDAAVYLDTGLIFPIVETWFQPSNYYNPANLRAAQLYLTRADAPDMNLKFLDLIPFADSYSLLFPGGYRHLDFISDGIFTGVIPGYRPDDVRNAQPLFEFIANHSLRFLNAYVKNDKSALAYLKQQPEDWSVTRDFVRVEHRTAEQPPPREWEFANLIREGNFERAKRIYHEWKQKKPETKLFNEDSMNFLGYEQLFSGNGDAAIKVFTLNVDAFPDSVNANDSLSEAYERTGNKELALKFAEKALELLKSDPDMPEYRRHRISEIIRARMKKLKEM